MEQIKAIEKTRLPPRFTHPKADTTRAEMFEPRPLEIGMAGDMSSKIFHACDDRMIVRRQSTNDLRIDTADATRLLKLKNPTVVEDFQVTVMLVSTWETEAIYFLAPCFFTMKSSSDRIGDSVPRA
jgi:hypothetical protein